MIDADVAPARRPIRSIVLLATGFAAATLVTATIILADTRAAQAKPEFAAQTGLPCGQCHVSPAGGGKLKTLGEKFKANGFKMPK
jgi:hypothetical protein